MELVKELKTIRERRAESIGFVSVKTRDVLKRYIWEERKARKLSNYGLTGLFVYCARF